MVGRKVRRGTSSTRRRSTCAISSVGLGVHARYKTVEFKLSQPFCRLRGRLPNTVCFPGNVWPCLVVVQTYSHSKTRYYSNTGEQIDTPWRVVSKWKKEQPKSVFVHFCDDGCLFGEFLVWHKQTLIFLSDKCEYGWNIFQNLVLNDWRYTAHLNWLKLSE